MQSYRFGAFLLDPRERRLLHDGVPVSLAPRAFDTLVYLVERGGHLVEKQELMDAIWRGSCVEDGNLPRTIHILRRALGEDSPGARYIETIPTKGYRFVADVTNADAVTISPEVSSEPAPETRAAESEARSSFGRWATIVGGAAALSVAVAALIVMGLGYGRVTSAPDRLQTDSGAAYSKYQAGRLFMERQYSGDHELALREFEAAIALDASFAEAYAGKADAKIFMYWNTGSHDDITQARLAVNKAIGLDSESSYAHTLLCRIRAAYDWDFAGAETECRRAIELDPDNHEARRELAFLMNALGRKDEALREMDNALALAPTSFNQRSRGVLLYFSRRFDDAVAQLKQVHVTDSEYPDSRRWIVRSLEQSGDYAQALEFLVQSLESSGDGSDTILRAAFESGGWPAVLRASLPRDQQQFNLESAETLAQLGEEDQAFEVLERMVSARRVMITHMDSDPRLDPLRTDPRFELIARRVGLR